MRVELQQLTKSFGEVVAVDAIDLEIKSGEFAALLGPSGCGKTTTLLMIAGIYRPTSGGIIFGDRRVEQLHPRERGIGMVFQSYALYPHMTVEQNIGFPLEVGARITGAERARRIKEASELVRVDELLARRPAQLSGGQQQRVALARALVKRPAVLLLDEPLSNLDARLRHEMRGEIKRLQKEVGITSVFVTHDQQEALTMADRVAVINRGRLEAYDTPDALYDRPPNRFVAEFIGDPKINLVPVDIARRDGMVDFRHAELGMELEMPVGQAPAGGLPGNGLLGIRPEDLRIVAPDRGDVGGEIYVIEPSGRETLVDVQSGDQVFRVVAEPGFNGRVGDTVGLHLTRKRLHLFDGKTEMRLL
ncbi:MAG: ABC transporter ATP-binding protein [Chloroflexota bacterium]|nr:ABC transporter ATP-binding protein [Chloroflexota bacterium]